MALWLQWNEAIWLWESYLIWAEDRVGVEATENRKDSDGNDQDDIINDQKQSNVATNKQAESKLDFTMKIYILTKQPPYHNITVNNILCKFSAIDFTSALSTFHRHNFPGTTVLPSIYDWFDAYKQLTIKTPQNPYLSEHKQTDRIWTSPFVKANGRSLEWPPHFFFDTALIIEDPWLYKSDGGIAGEFFFQ